MAVVKTRSRVLLDICDEQEILSKFFVSHFIYSGLARMPSTTNCSGVCTPRQGCNSNAKMLFESLMQLQVSSSRTNIEDGHSDDRTT